MPRGGLLENGFLSIYVVSYAVLRVQVYGFKLLVVGVGVVVMSPSGSADLGRQMPRIDEEFHVVQIVDAFWISISPSWCLTVILLNRGTT